VGIPREISDLGGLSRAERPVLAELDTGEVIVLGDGEVPKAGDESREVRAGLIRILLLGSDPKHQPHEKGVRIGGAWIPDALDLEGCRIPRDIALISCRFDATPVLRSACIDGLFLNRGVVPGLSADGLEATGDVFLRGVKATGEVRLLGARLGGDLDCVGATFRAETDAEGDPGNALSADRLEAQGGVFLRGVEATGAVRLSGAKLGGSLSCVGATFRAEKDVAGDPGDALSADGLEAKGNVFLGGVKATGAVRLWRARLGGSLTCTGATFRAQKDADGDQGNALTADGLKTGGSVFLRHVKATGTIRLNAAVLGDSLKCEDLQIFVGEGSVDGGIPAPALSARWLNAQSLNLANKNEIGGLFDLTCAKFRAIEDANESWPRRGSLMLDQCVYDAFIGVAAVDSRTRLDWLDQMEPSRWGIDFWPQPYEQCAKVLREMGHGEDARAILIEKERRQRSARQARLNGVPKLWFGFWDRLLGVTVRYGRQPLWAFYWLFCFWLVGAGVFGVAEATGALKPNKEVVLRSDEWLACAEAGPEAQAACYLASGRGGSYPQFNRWIYSADTLLPIVSLEMQEYWIPDDRKGWPGWGARGYLWVHIAVGWALSLLAVAGFSGLVKSD